MIGLILSFFLHDHIVVSKNRVIPFIKVFLVVLMLSGVLLFPCNANNAYVFGNDSWVVDNIHMDDPNGAWKETPDGKQYFYSGMQKTFFENQIASLLSTFSRSGLFAYNEYGEKIQFRKDDIPDLLDDILYRGSYLYAYNDSHDLVPIVSVSSSEGMLGGFTLTDIDGNPLFFPSFYCWKQMLSDSMKKVILYDRDGRKILDNSGNEFSMYYGEVINTGNDNVLSVISIEAETNKAYIHDWHKKKVYIYNRNGDQLYIEKNPYSHLFGGKIWLNAKPYDFESMLIDSDINFLNVADKVYFLTEAGAKIYVNPSYTVNSSIPILNDRHMNPLYAVDMSDAYFYDSETGFFKYIGTNVPGYHFNRNGTLTRMTVRGEDGWYDPFTWKLLYNKNGHTAYSRTLPPSGISPMCSIDQSILASIQQDQIQISISVPKISVSVEILGVPGETGNWDVSWLGTNAGWLQTTDVPGTQGDSNSVITAHSYLYNGLPGPFVRIGELGYGDRIILHAFGEEYIYSVTENFTAFADDLSVLNGVGYPCLTLITCKGYDEASDTYLYRVVVRARLTEIN